MLWPQRMIKTCCRYQGYDIIQRPSGSLVRFWFVGSVTCPENRIIPVKLSLIKNMKGLSHVNLGGGGGGGPAAEVAINSLL